MRIINNATGHVFYARTHDHSTMDAATGTTAVTTSFDVPSTIEAGPSTIQAAANGIVAQAEFAITVVSIAPPTITSVTPKVGPIAGWNRR